MKSVSLSSPRRAGYSAGAMNYHDRIVRDPAICGGQPVIRGTRVLVRIILGYLAHGEPIDLILHEFPSLEEVDVRAVIAFAAASASEDQLGRPFRAQKMVRLCNPGRRPGLP